MRRCRCAIVLVMLGGLVQAQSAWADPVKLLRTAEGLYLSESWEHAARLLDQALAEIRAQAASRSKDDPAPADEARTRRRVLYLLADAQRRAGEAKPALENSIAYFNELRQLTSSDAKNLQREYADVLADDYLRLKKFKESHQILAEKLKGRYGPLKTIPKLDVLVRIAAIEERMEQPTQARSRWMEAEKLAVELLQKHGKHLSPDERDVCEKYLELSRHALEPQPETVVEPERKT
jgi:hypothetical protein